MLVLGIDPGSTVTGYALVGRARGRYLLVTAGVVKTTSKQEMSARLLEIHQGLAAVLTIHRPEVVAIEAIFRHKSSESALRLGQARGVALLAAAQANLPVFEYNAMTVKKSVTGSGRADKQQIKRAVSMLTGQSPELPLDAYDAMAIAITHHAHAPHAAAARRALGTER
jgi:crossover junction endodeoxyribonuclease RuvC